MFKKKKNSTFYYVKKTLNIGVWEDSVTTKMTLVIRKMIRFLLHNILFEQFTIVSYGWRSYYQCAILSNLCQIFFLWILFYASLWRSFNYIIFIPHTTHIKRLAYASTTVSFLAKFVNFFLKIIYTYIHHFSFFLYLKFYTCF